MQKKAYEMVPVQMSKPDAQIISQRSRIAGQRRAVAPLRAKLYEVILSGWPGSGGLFSNFANGIIPIFAILPAIMIMGLSRPWSDRYLFSLVNAFQRLSTWDVL